MLKLGIELFKKYILYYILASFQKNKMLMLMLMLINVNVRRKKSQFSYLLEKRIWCYIYLFVRENVHLLVFWKH